MSDVNPNRRTVVVYDTQTGFIRQRSHVNKDTLHLQHTQLPGCDYLEVFEEVHPNDHKVDLATKRIVPRTEPTDWDKAVKHMEIHAGHRDSTRSQENKDSDHKRDALLERVKAAKTKDDLKSITWG